MQDLPGGWWGSNWPSLVDPTVSIYSLWSTQSLFFLSTFSGELEDSKLALEFCGFFCFYLKLKSHWPESKSENLSDRFSVPSFGFLTCIATPSQPLVSTQKSGANWGQEGTSVCCRNHCPPTSQMQGCVLMTSLALDAQISPTAGVSFPQFLGWAAHHAIELGPPSVLQRVCRGCQAKCLFPLSFPPFHWAYMQQTRVEHIEQ